MTNPRSIAQLTEARRHLDHGDLPRAEAICRALVAKDKRDINAWQMLGLIANRRGWFDKAVPCFEKCVKLRPDEPMTHCQLASARMSQGRFKEARAGFDRALKLRPRFPHAMRGKAELLERSGDPAGALALLEPFAERLPDPETGLLLASLTVKTDRPGDAVAIAERALSMPNVSPLAARKLHFAIGTAHDRAKDHDAAFAAYERANAIATIPYDRAKHDARTERILARFSGDALAALPRSSSASELPVFIVGMPRSGSTLVEQIIDAHPKAVGAGELTAFTDLMAQAPKQLGSTRPYPDWIDDTDAAGLDRLGRTYLAELGRRGRGAQRVADKNLLNHMHVGMISLLFPKARVILCRRDPVENAVSCYINDLSSVGFPWSNDLGDIGHQTRACARLMDHWPTALDLAMLEVVYEDLVNDQERVSRAIIDFCGLEWDDACLRFYETGRAVTTLSYDQVRQPIYRTAMHRSSRYERHLAPLRDALAAAGVPVDEEGA